MRFDSHPGSAVAGLPVRRAAPVWPLGQRFLGVESSRRRALGLRRLALAIAGLVVVALGATAQEPAAKPPQARPPTAPGAPPQSRPGTADPARAIRAVLRRCQAAFLAPTGAGVRAAWPRLRKLADTAFAARLAALTRVSRVPYYRWLMTGFDAVPEISGLPADLTALSVAIRGIGGRAVQGRAAFDLSRSTDAAWQLDRFTLEATAAPYRELARQLDAVAKGASPERTAVPAARIERLTRSGVWTARAMPALGALVRRYVTAVTDGDWLAANAIAWDDLSESAVGTLTARSVRWAAAGLTAPLARFPRVAGLPAHAGRVELRYGNENHALRPWYVAVRWDNASGNWHLVTLRVRLGASVADWLDWRSRAEQPKRSGQAAPPGRRATPPGGHTTPPRRPQSAPRK